MTEGPTPIERLLIVEDLRRLQARLCRLASAREWSDVEALFTSDGQFRAFGVGGVLECFADGAEIGSTIDGAVGVGVLVVRAFGEEFDVLSATRAEASCSIEDILFIGHRERVLHGFGSLSVAYRFDTESGWRIRSAEFSRIVRERR